MDDITPEKLVVILAENGGRIALLSPEGGIFDIMAGRYHNSQPVIDVYLKGHCGDTVRIDRIGREAESVEAPALTLGLAVQPESLRDLISNITFSRRGLTARFFYSQPPSLLGKRRMDTPSVLPILRINYENMIKKLFRLSLKPDDSLFLPEEALTFTDEAMKLLLAYREMIERTLGDDLSNIFKEWLGKLTGGVCRIAGIFHCIEHPDNPAGTQIDKDALGAAIDMGEYLEGHARCIFNPALPDLVHKNSERLLKWVITRNIKTFSARDAFHALKCQQLVTMEDFWTVLRFLEARHYIRRGAQSDRPGRGQKPSPTFEVNPEVFAQNRRNLQNSGNAA